MRKIMILFALLFVAGCSQEFVCNEPYIMAYGPSGDICCLDLDHDNVCDPSIAVEQSSETYHLEKNEGKTLSQLSLEKVRKNELEDEYEVKLAVWENEKERKQEQIDDEEMLEEYS